ncbi:MAG: peptidoglycan-binding domain-containing protein [Ilumatobacteraceae bacterium]
MRGFVRAIAIATLLVVAPDLGAPAVRAEVPEMSSCKADAELVVGSVGGSVYCVQWTLMWQGLYKGLVNGTYDQATFQAVVAFQQAHPPLSINGKSGEQTLTAMGIYSGVDQAPPPPCLADAPVNPGDRGPSAECVQRVLTEKKLFLGTVDGTYGKATQDAVKSFQLVNPPLKADGVADTQTLAALGIWSGFTRSDGSTSFNAGPWWPATMQAEPNFRLVGGIPVFGNHRICTRENADIIAAEFAKDGADTATQQFFIYIASREGGCDHTSVNVNAVTRDDSHCTFQLNALSGMFEPNGQLGRRGWNVDNVKESMANCADAASDLWVFCARGPWTPPYSCAPPWAGDLGPEGDV